MLDAREDHQVKHSAAGYVVKILYNALSFIKALIVPLLN